MTRTRGDGARSTSLSPTLQGLDEEVAALLRRVADSIEALGDVDVHDVVFHSHVTDGEDDLTMTVYYDEQPRRR